MIAAQRALPIVEERGNGSDDFVDGNRFHASEIDWAFAEETRAAFNLVSNNAVPGSEGAGEPGLSRTEEGHDGDRQDSG